ncbi:MAG: AtpZ/AtpI family protein [Janthinobacterium lividum]
MKPTQPPNTENGRTKFSRQIGAKAARKIRAQTVPGRSIWLGFGVTGVIGWSVAAPALVGALLGVWLDSRYPGSRSWTLMLLVAGLCLGCFQAWNWVAKEDKAMHEEQHIPNEPKETEQKENDNE